MNALLRESDACLELLEQAILAGRRRVPRDVRERVQRLAAAAGHRRTRPPIDPVEAHDFVFEIQGARLLPHDPAEPVAKARPKPRRLPKTRRRVPLFGSLDWLETRRPSSRMVSAEWAWEVWREAADLARVQPTPERAAAMQDAWAYYWALVGGEDERPDTARRAA
jgi:hypothetical protein